MYAENTQQQLTFLALLPWLQSSSPPQPSQHSQPSLVLGHGPMKTNYIQEYCVQTPPRENWFQYVRREYAPVFNFPSLITQVAVIFSFFSFLAFLEAGSLNSYKKTTIVNRNIVYYLPRILQEHLCIYSCLQTQHRENWLQYVHREFATVFNFPSLITLVAVIFSSLAFLGAGSYKNNKFL